MPTPSLTIDVIADIVCPWCYLGRNRLIKAISLLPDVDIKTAWKPFQLAPEIPASGKPYQDHIKSVYGSRDDADDAERTLIELGEEDGILFDFESIQKAPNTLDAHRTIYWAAQDEKGTQDKLVHALFSRYFERGQDIGQHVVLVNAAEEAGMRADVVEKLLKTDIDRDTVMQDIAGARYIGIQGVPCFIIDKKFAVMGAQSVDVLADTIQQTASGFEPGLVDDR